MRFKLENGIIYVLHRIQLKYMKLSAFSFSFSWRFRKSIDIVSFAGPFFHCRILLCSFSSKARRFSNFPWQPRTGWNNLGNVVSDQIIWRAQSPIRRAQSPFMIVFQIDSLEWVPRRETIDFSFKTFLYLNTSSHLYASKNDPFPSITSLCILRHL